MALINDPDNLNQDVEVVIDTSALTIQLVVGGNLSNDGVVGQTLYSFLKEEWIQDPDLPRFRFPMESITPEQFGFINGWLPADDTTRNLLRSCGWDETNTDGSLARSYAGIISLGNIDPADVGYYAFASDSAKTDFDFPGPINQAIQTYGDASNGAFDKRDELLTLRIRTEGKTYGEASTTDIGVDSLTSIAYRFPLSEAVDTKVAETDTNIDANAPYTSMSITWGAVQRDIGGTLADFSIVVDGAGATAEQIYEFVQRQLRLATDIDDGAGTEIGLLTQDLLSFQGDALTTSTGVYVDGFDPADTNRITFTDDADTEHTFPFVAAGVINFNPNLVADPAAEYHMFYTTNPAGDFGTVDAVIVKDAAGNDIAGLVNGLAARPFDFDYDGNVQGGRTAGTDDAVTIVAIGLDSAQYVLATGTLSRATGLSFSLVSALERNYANA